MQWQEKATVIHWFIDPCVHHGNTSLPILLINIWVCTVLALAWVHLVNEHCTVCFGMYDCSLCLILHVHISFWTVLMTPLWKLTSHEAGRAEWVQRDKHLFWIPVYEKHGFPPAKWAVSQEQTMARQSKKNNNKKQIEGRQRNWRSLVWKADRGSGRKGRKDTKHKYCLEVERKREAGEKRAISER